VSVNYGFLFMQRRNKFLIVNFASVFVQEKLYTQIDGKMSILIHGIFAQVSF